ncbi:hypothetical protein VIC01_03188 [Phocaeicola vulgatus]|uniref:Uncharacterized protein n=1 Tax=Phocaeicola vulgatus TaxID=821 RepID=A0A5P3AYC2_PHOVU|nr:hypothetical protein VIC01_03188 [Phocaeicola vulgatus]
MYISTDKHEFLFLDVNQVSRVLSDFFNETLDLQLYTLIILLIRLLIVQQ